MTKVRWVGLETILPPRWKGACWLSEKEKGELNGQGFKN